MDTAINNAHLSNQNYEICIRRARGYCSVCFSPVVVTTGTVGSATSWGLTAAWNDADAGKSGMGSLCFGITQMEAASIGAINVGKD